MSNYPPNGAPPWNGYGAPPPQGYGAPPPQGYGAPPPQGYGAPPPQGYGAPPPPQQGYGAPPQSYSAPPPGAPPQGYPGQQQGYAPPPQQGYSAPPQQQPYGYPPQQGNYAQPPPPGQYGPPQGYSQQGQYAQPPPPGQYGRLPNQGYGASPQAIPQAIPQAVPQGAGGLPMTPGNHSSNQNVTFYVEEKVGSATQDSFAVKDKNGRLIYDVVGSFTANEKKTMKDMHGKTLLQIREARLTVKEKITISSAQNAPLITIEQKSGMQMGNKTAVAYFGNTTKGRQAFAINGDRKATHFRVTGPSGNELAIIARKASSFKKKLTGQDSYVTTVMAGADHALMCMVTVACDEIWSD